MTSLTRFNPDAPGSATRDRLIKAAVQLFSEKGYQGATTREIALTAGVSEVTLFRHFASKDQLLEAAINTNNFSRKLRDLIPTLTELPPAEGLQIIAEELLDTLAERTAWIKILHVEAQRSSSAPYQLYHHFLDELFAAYSSYFSAMQTKGEMKHIDPELLGRAFHGIFFCFFNIEEILNRKDYRPTDRKRAIAEFVNIFAHGTLQSPSLEPIPGMNPDTQTASSV